MKLITFLYEVSDVLGPLTDLDAVRLIPSAGNCVIEGLAEYQIKKYQKGTVCSIQAVSNEAVEDLPETVGIYPLNAIFGALRSPGMDRETAIASFKPDLRVPMLKLIDPRGNSYEIALLREELAAKQIQIGHLKEKSPPYEVTTSPTEAGIALLKHWSGEMRKAGEDCWIVPSTNDSGQLLFSYLAATDRIDFVFANGVSGVLAPDWSLRDKPFLQVLKQYRTSKAMTVKLWSKGLMTVELRTTLASYLFHFPATVV